MVALTDRNDRPLDVLAGGACCLLENRPVLPSECHVLSDASGRAPSRTGGLTAAERRVLALLLAGCSNKEISSALGRAEPTIKHQVSACLRKLGQPSRARLIAALR
jgi:DNA-binding NarL/FixJ family response regulator